MNERQFLMDIVIKLNNAYDILCSELYEPAYFNTKLTPDAYSDIKYIVEYIKHTWHNINKLVYEKNTHITKHGITKEGKYYSNTYETVCCQVCKANDYDHFDNCEYNKLVLEYGWFFVLI
jgi:hypothetical protein